MNNHPRRRVLSGLLGLSLALTACGGSDADAGDGGGASAAPPQSKVVIPAADVANPVSLQEGRYKFGWLAPGCAKVAFTLTGASKGFTYAKSSTLTNGSAVVLGVLEDTYALGQTEAACTTWTVTIDKL
jgi:hypothetical protein